MWSVLDALARCDGDQQVGIEPPTGTDAMNPAVEIDCVHRVHRCQVVSTDHDLY